MAGAKDPLFERYKDALRRGHLATLRDRLDQALAAYTEAAAIAPDRALPHVSQGGVLRRLGREDEALMAYGRAIERVPSDMDALAGRAEVLLALDRRVAAAEAFVVLAEVHEREGRSGAAGEAARRALQVAESRERRGAVERLVGRIRGPEIDPQAREAVRRALQILEPSASAAPQTDIVEEGSPDLSAETVPALPADPVPADGPARVLPQAVAAPDPLALIAEAEARRDAGDLSGSVRSYLDAAAALRDDHRWRVALDACAQALVIVPTDGRLHLDLVEIYLAAGWTALAADKLRLVSRLAALDGDSATTERLCGIVRTSFGDDPDLTELCA